MTHPTIRHLTDYAAGSLPRGLSLLVASHLTYCPGCRAKLARLELVGGALLAEPPADPVRAPSLEATLSRIGPDAQRGAPAPKRQAAPLLPTPIRALLDERPATRWRRLLPTLWVIRLPGGEGEDVRLLKGRPGTRIPDHTHAGEESTLVLSGFLRDGERVFGRGDVSVCGPEHDHRPEVVGEVECLCLIVLSGRMQFTGPFGRILNLLPQ